jgi:hypothetical protein
MSHTRRSFAALLIVTLPITLAAQNTRGSAYTATITTDSGGRKTTMSIQTEVLDARSRISIKTDAVPGVPVDMYMIVDSAAGTMTNVMPAQSMAMITDMSLVKNPAAAPYTMDLAGEPKVTVVDLGPGEPILGHATRHYKQTTSYVMNITIGGETCTKPTEEVSEVWATPDNVMPVDILNSSRGLSGGAISPLLRKLDSLKKTKIKGGTLRMLSTMTSTSATGEPTTAHVDFRVTEIKLGSIDPMDFEVPDGFRTMDARAMMAGVNPEMLKQAMANARSNLGATLKKTLCGAP